MINKMMQVTNEYWLPKRINFILRKRYCLKHAKKYLGKGKSVVMLLGICSKCGEAGVCYYDDTK